MRPIKLSLMIFLVASTLLWLLADTLAPSPFGYFPFRGVFVQYTGVVAILAMSVAMYLALRPRWLEARVDGLDKTYRLHKWLGITALVVSVLHWWWAKGTKWMVGWGWLSRPERRGAGGGEALHGVAQWFHDQRGFAESVGEWTFYVLVVFLALALIKRFPYRLFQKTHRWIAIVYLLLAYHAVVLTKFDYWSQPVGWVQAVLLAIGVVAALISLTGRLGAGRKVGGRVEQLIDYPELRVLETALKMEAGWPGHKAGQFAFLTVDDKEGAHPFTIASDWDPATREMVFITKALGDYTSRLHEALLPGSPVVVEGPYGCFTFDDDCPRQIWVGAGIGITPFVARMQQLARHGRTQHVDLFHPSADVSPAALERLRADAEAAGVRLHLVLGKGPRRVDGTMIREEVPHWREASLWFCGPSGFGAALKADFTAHGLPASRFHQELFEMR